jgi:hypothetical protein
MFQYRGEAPDGAYLQIKELLLIVGHQSQVSLHEGLLSRSVQAKQLDLSRIGIQMPGGARADMRSISSIQLVPCRHTAVASRMISCR